MRFSILALFALASAALAQESTSQDPGPSPTASVGCEPHGDHWYVSALFSNVVAPISNADLGTAMVPHQYQRPPPQQFQAQPNL